MSGSPAEQTRRLFFALWPDAGQQAALALAAREAIQSVEGRAVPAGNLHLTLAFLGSVPERRIPELAALARSLRGVPDHEAPLRFSFAHLEHWRRAQVLCATPEVTSAGAVALAEALQAALVAASFAPDLKPFRTHVTLARKVRHASQQLGMRPVSWSFSSFALVESRTQIDGVLYSALDSWELSRLHSV